MEHNTIDALFSRLTMAYGTRFREQWAGQSPEAVKRLWRHELRSMPAHRIRWALNHLPPDFPPNAMQFRSLCAKAPSRDDGVPQLTQRWAPPDPSMLSRMQALADPSRLHHDPLAWAVRLRDRERSGEHLTALQREAWREALRYDEERGNPVESTG